jgi:nitrogen regulatory protein P-II 1
MKELDVYIVPEDLSKISKIFDEHGVAYRAKHDVQGSGRSKRKEIHEVVDSRMTGRKFTPKYEKRTHLLAFVPDSSAKKIIEEILNSLGKKSEPRGLILVKEISNAYEIGTRKSGNSVLTAD